MESLVLLVTLLFLIVIISGPTALFLTWLPAINREDASILVVIIRSIVVTLLALLGGFTSLNVMLRGSTMATTLIGFFGTLISVLAIQREYFPGGFRTIIGKEGKNKKRRRFFGHGNDPQNGPSGQH